jgi:hypothetical protein
MSDQEVSDDQTEGLADRALDGLIDELLRDVPDHGFQPALYHYSTAEGARGILDSETIWASDVRFLNDSSEWKYALALAREVLTNLPAIPHPDWQDLTEELDQLSRMTSYVACFSRADDQLSQWRAYSGQGYALGFDFTYLASLSEHLPLTVILAPVLYDLDRQREAMRRLLTEVLPANPEDTEADGLRYRHLLLGALSIAAAFFKNPAFAHEDEWRLAVRPPDDPQKDPMPLQFRTLRGAVVPYRIVKLARIPIKYDESMDPGIRALLPDYRTRLLEVVVGPGPDQDIAELGMKTLLTARQFGEAKVRVSTTPFRG